MQSIPVCIHFFIYFPTKATQMDRIDPCLHIVKARILEDTLPLIRWMRCGDRAAAAEEEAEKEEEDGDEVKKGEEGVRRWRRWRRMRRQTIEGRLDGEQCAGRCDSSAFTIPVKVSAARQPDDLMASAALVEVTCCIFSRWLCSSTSPAHLHPAAPPPLLWSFNSFLSHPSIHPSKRWEGCT